MTRATVVGYSPDGNRVVLWEQDHPWLDQHDAFLDTGCGWLRLDHVAPGLIETLRASLTPLPATGLETVA